MTTTFLYTLDEQHGLWSPLQSRGHGEDLRGVDFHSTTRNALEDNKFHTSNRHAARYGSGRLTMGGGPQRSFGEILDELCLHPPGRDAYGNTALARLVRDLGGSITPGYLSHMRAGVRDNPTLEVLEYLAAALNVSPAVFVGGRRERHGDERPRQSFSKKLRLLFAVVYPLGRRPLTPEEVATAITAKGEYGTISPSYIRELLTPPTTTLPNPRLKHILGLAGQFGLSRDDVPDAAYFLDGVLAAEIDAELEDLAALRSSGVVEFFTRLAEQAPTWSPELRRQIVDAFTHAVEGQADWVFWPPTNP